MQITNIPRLIDFDSKTSSQYYLSEEIFDLKDSLKKLKEFKLVISDNLIEVLEFRPDAIILGHFFGIKS